MLSPRKPIGERREIGNRLASPLAEEAERKKKGGAKRVYERSVGMRFYYYDIGRKQISTKKIRK